MAEQQSIQDGLVWRCMLSAYLLLILLNLIHNLIIGISGIWRWPSTVEDFKLLV
jgi:hypothetical protein